MEEDSNAKGKKATCHEHEDEDLNLDAFFVDKSYKSKLFEYGSHVVEVLCLDSSATDYDLTGQIVWPGADLLNNFLVENYQMLGGLSVLELGSGIGVTGLLCSRFCRKIVMTDHMKIVLEVLQSNIDGQRSKHPYLPASMSCEKLEWGNDDDVINILEKHHNGFDVILGADICYQQVNIPPLFKTVNQILKHKPGNNCRFILAYVSRAKSIDVFLQKEAENWHLKIKEILGTRKKVSHGVFEGVIYEIISPKR